MSLVLSGRDAERFSRASRVLLSPLEHAGLEAWGEAVNAALCDLFSAQRSALVLPRSDGVRTVHRDFDPDFVEEYETAVATSAPGSNRYVDPKLDLAMARLARSGLTAWTTALAERVSRIPPEGIPFFQDVMIPAGLLHMVVSGVPHDEGIALCAVFHDGPRADRFGEARLDLATMLAPAFEAGVLTLDRLHAMRSTMGRMVDEIPGALLICDDQGREILRNRALREVLLGDPEHGRVVEEMLRVAATVTVMAGGSGATSPSVVQRSGTGAVRTDAHDYSIHAGFVAPGVFGARGSVAIILERAAPVLPSPERLRERWSLTAREAEVAIQLALGHSNRQIADELGCSVHTIRHHAEHVFLKLDVHTRKALALKLLSRP